MHAKRWPVIAIRQEGGRTERKAGCASWKGGRKEGRGKAGIKKAPRGRDGPRPSMDVSAPVVVPSVRSCGWWQAPLAPRSTTPDRKPAAIWSGPRSGGPPCGSWRSSAACRRETEAASGSYCSVAERCCARPASGSGEAEAEKERLVRRGSRRARLMAMC